MVSSWGICRCLQMCVWLPGPGGDSPFKRSDAEYLSGVGFWGNKDHWAHSLNIFGTQPLACHCGLGSLSVHPSPPPANFKPVDVVCVLGPFESKRHFYFSKHDTGSICIYIYQRGATEVYLYWRILREIQKYLFVGIKKNSCTYTNESKGLYAKSLDSWKSSREILIV